MTQETWTWTDADSEHLLALFAGLLESHGIYLQNTDHLPPSDVLRWLYQEVPGIELPPRNVPVVLDPLDDELTNYLRYYADDEYRKMWAQDFPEDIIPPHEEPVYKRNLPGPKN